MDIVSRIGEGRGENDLGDLRLTAILRNVRRSPALPLTLRCHVRSDYAYQNPHSEAADAPFQVRADLAILQRMGLMPGDTRPAIDLFERLLDRVETGEGILWFADGVPREQCPYEAGRAKGIAAIIPPRGVAEMRGAKALSVEAIRTAETLDIRPHHLMCMTCFHGGRDALEPIDEDNLFEAIEVIQAHPEIPIRLVCGPCMICPPCPHFEPSSARCLGGKSMALRDELKDLEVLRRLGLTYGDVLPARVLFTRLYDCVPSALDVCGFGDGVERAPEWRVCGGEDVDARYALGRSAGLGFL
ncbi:MAG TPA: hypothetical protein PLO37_00425 [Candidatus Hydrogenedentes bacterium]|nr:hypothetical protein [Candidatus Hydrogenedentota bacterium]